MIPAKKPHCWCLKNLFSIGKQVIFISDGQKPEFFENPGFGFDPGFKMKNPGFSG